MTHTDKFFLFDIDGTLLNVKKGFIRTLIQDMISGMGLHEPVLDHISFAGRTDRDIFSGLLQLNGISPARFDDFRAGYLEYLEQNMSDDDVSAVDGIENVVRYFSDQQLPTGLLTGNFREAAFIKLNRASLDTYFETGAFGCDHADRNKLPEIAFDEGQKLIGTRLRPSDLVIIGDTPRDIECARSFGAVSVAVSTGSYSYEELNRERPDLMLESLSQPEAWLNKIPA